MLRLIPLLMFLLSFLTACGQDLHFKIRYDEVSGLREGDPLLLDEQPIGKVVAVKETEDGGHLVEVAIPRESASSATSEANFILAGDPENPQRRRIEVIVAGPGGKPITEGAVVRGSYPNPLGSFSLGEIMNEFGGLLGKLRSQVELFRKEFEKLPNSPESKRLEEEWHRLMNEIAKAQSSAGETMNRELLPKLQKEMDELRKRMEEMSKNPAKNAQEI
ncbi:MAG: hypothetical protein PHE55_06225 [Methylococcaceae bacterium]|nr:hypothetical protein [Methylococcaceae bacterium]